jgi:hypothetical protein
VKNKIVLFGIVAVVVAVLAVAGAGFAFAQTPAAGAGQAQTPVAPDGYGPGWMMGGTGASGYGRGMMGGYAQTSTTWESMQAMHQWMTAGGVPGGMHTFVWNAVADKLGLTSDQLTAGLNSGKTLAQIAEAKGVSRADLVAALEVAHKASLAQAVKDGILTQAQADTMLAQMAGRYDWMLDNMGAYAGTGAGYGRGMMGGYGQGMMGGYAGTGTGYGRGMMGNWGSAAATPAPKP